MRIRSKSLLELWAENRTAPAKEDHLTARLRKLSQRTDGGLVVSIARQNAKRARLLPPPGTAVFRRLSPESLAKIEKRKAEDKVEKKERKKQMKVAKEDLPKPCGHLEEGEVLPFIYGDPPPELINAPLEDLDPFYRAEKTFISISKGNMISRFNAEPACYLLNPFNIVRRGAIRVLTHSFFRLFIVLTILCHFVLLSLEGFSIDWYPSVELVFTGIYTLEALIKVSSRGLFLGQFTYLRDPWNWLDLFLLIMEYLNLFLLDLGNVSALRMFRVLQTLNSNCLRTFRGALVQSVRKLASVMLFVIFCLSIFAIIGMQMFMGTLRQKCTMMFANESWAFEDSNSYFLPGQLDALLCGNSSDAGTCPEGYTCIRRGGNPNYGYTNYDNFGWAFLSIFRIMTYDFMENLFQLIIRSSGKIYTLFFAAIILGCFYLVNLILAVITMAYAEQNQAAIAEAKEDELEYQRIVAQLKKQGVHVMENTGEGAACQEVKDLEEPRRPCRRGWDTFVSIFLKWDCCAPWACKKWMHSVMTHPFMDLFFTICVIVNTLFMAMVHYPMTYHFEEVLSIAELAFTLIFAAEMVLKIIAMSPYYYFKVGWNIFDCITAILTVVELGLGELGGLSMLRVFRLGKSWPTFNMLIKMMRLSVAALGKVTLVLLGTALTFAVLAKQLFRKSYMDCVCKIAEDCELPRWHMTDFFHSFLTVFRVLCGEWIEIMWDLMEVAGQFWGIIFMIPLAVIAKLLVVHVFLALLLGSFHGDYLSREDQHMVNFHIATRRICRGLAWVKEFINVRLLGKKPNTGGAEGDSKKENLVLEHMDPKKDVKMVPIAKAELDFENLDDDNDRDVTKKKDGEHSSQTHDCKPVEVAIATEKAGPQDCFTEGCVRRWPCLTVDITQGRGKVWWNLRRTCFTIVEHTGFQAFIIVIIISSCAALAFEDIYIEQRQVLKIILENSEHIFTCVFVVEMLLKWMGYGFKTYFANGWCWLEFLIVNISLLNSTATILGYSGMGPLKVLRALRMLSVFDGTRLVLNTFFGAIPSIFNALLACLTFWLIFNILGVRMFAGKFSHCINTTSNEIYMTSEVNNKTECLELMYNNFTEVLWSSQKVNFDNVPNGYLALLHVATFQGWMDLMYAAVDARYVEDQPQYEASPSMYLYFVIFTLGSFFTFSLFLGILIDNYHQQKAKMGGKDLFMTEGQRKTWMASLESQPKPIPRPQNRIQGLVFDLVTKPLFELVMMVVACMYFVTLMTETDNQSSIMEQIQHWFLLIYILILAIECALKLFALRQHYFTAKWNIFDFVVVIFSIVGIFLTDLLEKYFVSPTIWRVLRAGRIISILRLSRLGKNFKQYSNNLNALMMSLPALFNFVLLLFIIMFIYSITGMSLFAYVSKKFGISDMMNFETFSNSMMCMFQITTMSDWCGLLLPTLNQLAFDCDPDFENPGTSVKGNCGNPFAGKVFFCSYILISFFIGINMFIAIILEHFKVTTKKNDDLLCEDDLKMFYKTWEKFDPEATQYVDYSRLSDFCDALEDPLRIPKPNAVKLITMDLPMTPGDKIHCRDVLTALTTEILGDSEEMDSLKASMEEKFMMNDPSKLAYEPITTTLKRKQEVVAAEIIQRAYRKHLPKKEDKESPEKERMAGKQPIHSLEGNQAAEEDLETQPLMGSEDGRPAADPEEISPHGGPHAPAGEVTTEAILHSANLPKMEA